MSTGSYHTTDDLRRAIARLTDEVDALTHQREYLLSQAIPKLEHEYLYCINSLEHEAAKLEGELYRLATIIAFYEQALQNNSLPQQEETAALIRSLTDRWNDETKKFKYSSPDDQSVIPMLQYERDEIASHIHQILRYISKYSLNDGTEHYTYLLRRVSESYRAGNIGELRALRIILEGKAASLTALKRKKSFARKAADWCLAHFQLLLAKKGRNSGRSEKH